MNILMRATEKVRVLMAKMGSALWTNSLAMHRSRASRDGPLLFPAHHFPTFTVLCQQCRESHSSGWFDASVVTRFVSMVSLKL